MTKILVSFDDRLLKRVDAAARKAGLDRSAYLRRLAEQALDPGSPSVLASRAAALRHIDEIVKAHPTPGGSTDFIRRARDGRHIATPPPKGSR